MSEGYRRRRWSDHQPYEKSVDSWVYASGNHLSDAAKTHRDQRLRLYRFRLAATGYCFFLGVTAYLWLGGQLQLTLWGLVGLIGGAVALNAGFAVLIMSGKNLHFRDPSMTALQTLGLVLIVLFLDWTSRTLVAQDAAAMALVVGLLFGMFRLDARELSILAAVAFTGFTLLAVVREDALGLDAHTTVVRIVIIGGVLAWTTVFASYVGQLRRRLGRRNAELREALSKLEELARHDGLTGIFNRREVFRQLEEALEEGLRLGVPVSVSLFDLDAFKEINDRYGHAVGDEVLREFVQRVKVRARSLDRLGRVAEGAGFGRYGGEEFLMVMPVTGLEGARDAAERIREEVASKPFVVNGESITVTVSQGVAEAGKREPLDHLLARADRALYQAKRDGRDCVRAAKPFSDDDVYRDGPFFFNLNTENR